MIPGAVLRALGQIGDPAFRSVLWRGLGLTVALLVGLYALVFWGTRWLLPETVTLPFLGPTSWVDDLMSGASLLLMIGLSVFLMVPVASAFTGLFLDEVADAVEVRHYPSLGPAPRLSWGETIRESLRFLLVILFANLAALVAYLALAPVAPFIFYALNGFLLGREYFQITAHRRRGGAGAKAMRRRHLPAIWAAGVVMAVPLTVPIVNLVVPILGAAVFTHLYHALDARDRRAR